MTDFYSEDARLAKIRLKNLQRDNQLFGAIYNKKQQDALMGSDVIMLNNHSNDLANIIKQNNEIFDNIETARAEAVAFLRRFASPDDSTGIVDNLEDDEVFFLAKNQSVITKELRKYNNLTPLNFIQIIQMLMTKDSNFLKERGEEEFGIAPELSPLEQKYRESGRPRPKYTPALDDFYTPLKGRQPKKKASATTPNADIVEGELPGFGSIYPNGPIKVNGEALDPNLALDIFRNPATGRFDNLTTIRHHPGALNDLSIQELVALHRRFLHDGALGVDENDIYLQNADKSVVKYKKTEEPRKETKAKLMKKMRANAEEVAKQRLKAAGPGGGGRAVTRKEPEPEGEEFIIYPKKKAVATKKIGAAPAKKIFKPVVFKSSKGPNNVSGKGLKLIHGRGHTEHQTVSFKKNWKYYDRIYIDLDRLKNNVLFIKFINNNISLQKLKTQNISDDLRDMIMDTINDRYNKKLFNTLEDSDKRIFRFVAKAFKMRLDIPEDEVDVEFREKYKILIGSFLSGNDSPELKKELLKYIRIAIAESKIPQQEGFRLLYELSA